MLDCCIAKKLNRIMPECRYTMTANVSRLCVRAGFLALHLIRRTALQLYTKLSIEARHPA